MDKIKDEDDKVTLAHEDVQEFIQKMGYQYSPMMIAAVMIVQAMRLYKSSLNQEEYDMMMSNIFQSRNRIK